MNRRLRPRDRSAALPSAQKRPLAFWGLLVLLVAAPLLVYAQTLGFDFIGLDDNAYVYENPHVQAGLGWWNLVWSFTTFEIGNWAPLTWLSYMLDTSLFGVRPAGYHLTNILLHAANTGLLFVLLVRITKSTPRSAFVAALFALHPLHVESVAWIAERKDVLSIFFGLLAMLAYVRYAAKGRWIGLAASVVCYVLSLMTKQTLVTLPFLLLLLDYWPLGRLAAIKDARRLVLEKLPFFAAAIAFSWVAVIAQKRTIRPFTVLPMGTRIENALVAYASYLWQAVYPQRFAVFYPYAADKMTAADVAVSALVVLGISVAAIVWVRRYPYLFVGWFWYLGTLVPMIGIVQVGAQQRADRYTYFPLIGFSLAVAWLVPEVLSADRFRRRALAGLATAALVLCALTTFGQAAKWTNSIVLFTDTLANTDNNAFGHFLLGTAQLNAQQVPEGIANLETAVQIDPHDASYQYNLANGLKRAGRLDEAAKHYQAVLAIDDRHIDARNNLALILIDRKQYDEAKRLLFRCLEIDPNHLRVLVNLSDLSLKTGDYDQAIAYGRRALAINPRLLNALECIALALRGQGHVDEAIAILERLAAGDPGDQKVRQELDETRAMKRGSQ